MIRPLNRDFMQLPLLIACLNLLYLFLWIVISPAWIASGGKVDAFKNESEDADPDADSGVAVKNVLKHDKIMN